MAIFVEKESDQIRERETRSERKRKSSCGPGRAACVTRPRSRDPSRAAWASWLGSREPQVSRGLGRTTWVAWLGACATQAAKLAWLEVRRDLGGSDFFWVLFFVFVFFFPSGFDFIFVGVVVLLYMGL